MADMVFDGGLGYVARLGTKLAKQAPMTIAKIAKAAEKISEATKPERESIVATPERLQISLKAEMEGAQKKDHAMLKKILITSTALYKN